jgi:hypothetical protein
MEDLKILDDIYREFSKTLKIEPASYTTATMLFHYLSAVKAYRLMKYAKC